METNGRVRIHTGFFTSLGDNDCKSLRILCFSDVLDVHFILLVYHSREITALQCFIKNKKQSETNQNSNNSNKQEEKATNKQNKQKRRLTRTQTLRIRYLHPTPNRMYHLVINEHSRLLLVRVSGWHTKVYEQRDRQTGKQVNKELCYACVRGVGWLFA